MVQQLNMGFVGLIPKFQCLKSQHWQQDPEDEWALRACREDRTPLRARIASGIIWSAMKYLGKCSNEIPWGGWGLPGLHSHRWEGEQMHPGAVPVHGSSTWHPHPRYFIALQGSRLAPGAPIPWLNPSRGSGDEGSVGRGCAHTAGIFSAPISHPFLRN